jgi:hypothetical protein
MLQNTKTSKIKKKLTGYPTVLFSYRMTYGFNSIVRNSQLFSCRVMHANRASRELQFVDKNKKESYREK